ncbi:unnamed protein product [marine sediment metagenome]|uniref:Uncharacterized protein n=1 Tax=marine sediment metagenome TaxID=412755 RepID=X1LWL2_9ZZZZ
MSVEAHGKVGRALVFATNRWGQYVKIYTIPRYTNTEGQKKVRHAYGQIGQLWRTMTPEQKEVYHAGAKRLRINPFNYFFKVIWPDFYVLEYSTITGKAILNKNYLGFGGY